MTYEELKITIDLNGHENILSSIGRKCLNDSHWFVVCDDGDCHLFDENGKEDDIKKITVIYEDIIPKDIKKIVIPNNVTSINQSTFYDCDCLNSVIIGYSVTSIRNWTFYKCNRLINVMIPDNMTNIEDHAFYGCSGLMSMMIPNCVTSIGYGAFRNCISLKSLIFKGKTMEQVKEMKHYPFGIKDESIIKYI